MFSRSSIIIKCTDGGTTRVWSWFVGSGAVFPVFGSALPRFGAVLSQELELCSQGLDTIYKEV